MVEFDLRAKRISNTNVTRATNFQGLIWCHKEKTETTNRGEVVSSNSILRQQDGTALYINRYIEPVFFAPGDVRGEIARLTAKFKKLAREFRMPQRPGLPNALIAAWGAVELEPLNASDVSVLESGGRPDGILISFLGDLQRSAKAHVPFTDCPAVPDTSGQPLSTKAVEVCCAS